MADSARERLTEAEEEVSASHAERDSAFARAEALEASLARAEDEAKAAKEQAETTQEGLQRDLVTAVEREEVCVLCSSLRL